MSNHHYDKESEMVGTINVDNTVSRHHSHSHIHFKPTIVFDHLRTKVKRKTKRSSNNTLNEAPAFATDDNNHMLQRSSHDHNKLEIKTTLPTCRSQPNITQTVSDQSFAHNHEENDPPIEREKDEDIIEPIRFQLSPIESDIDNNKNNKSKSKLNKITKTPSDLNNQTNTRKRRQIARHTGFQIRDEDFNHIFNELPSDEQLIVAYPCSWRKDIFMHGRMFLSVNYLCFYTCFFKWEESLSIAYKDITSVTREKSAKVLPNAIQLRTKNREQFLFASYIPRERIFIAIFRLWQNALLEKPLDYQQLRSIVFADQMSIDGSSGDSEESIVLDNNNEPSSKNSLQSQSSSPIPLGNLIESAPSFIKPDERIIASLSSSSEPTCPCETHLNRTYADQIFSYHVDQLFELTYGDNSFTRNYHDSQKLTDYTIGEWHVNNETRKRERLVTYKTVTQSIFGTNTISCSEKQILEIDKPQSMYVINTEVFNEGMKYTDAFFVATRVCMWQRDAKTSSLRITAEIKYIKNVNGIAKSFIEKNCNSNIEDSINNLIRRLDNHQTTIKKSKHHQRKKQDHQIDFNQNIIKPSLNNQTKTITGKGVFFDIIFFIGILLLILHIYLCYKLYSIDRALFNIDQICLDDCRKVCLSNK